MTGVDEDVQKEIERLTQRELPSLERSGKDLQRVRELNERLREESNAKRQ